MKRKKNMKPYIPSLSEKEYKDFLERSDVEEISQDQTGSYKLTKNNTRVIPVACLAREVIRLSDALKKIYDLDIDDTWQGEFPKKYLTAIGIAKEALFQKAARPQAGSPRRDH